ncbi:hypothetical protein [Halobacillus sp. A5]|uniref:hypothetical protein n=1 Tax=Halobacillus sp. A5 TaxID=2880263 RepID=UPI002111DE37|nr:hypothetical protein [Halobacillus sp. A5]
MDVVPYNEQEIRLLSRLMRAEAEGDGKQAILMAGNTGATRWSAERRTFKFYAPDQSECPTVY